MHFRLTYEGELKARQRELHAGQFDKMAEHKQAIRKVFHKQMLREVPGEGEDPFFCLLEDDKLVSRLSVETDTLLDPPTGNADFDRRQVKLVIGVEIKPYHATMFNLSFV